MIAAGIAMLATVLLFAVIHVMREKAWQATVRVLRADLLEVRGDLAECEGERNRWHERYSDLLKVKAAAVIRADNLAAELHHQTRLYDDLAERVDRRHWLPTIEGNYLDLGDAIADLDDGERIDYMAELRRVHQGWSHDDTPCGAAAIDALGNVLPLRGRS